MNTQIETVEEAAEKYARESFIPKKNAYGDNVMQRVGQNPMGWSKHCKSARKHFKAGANWMSKTMYNEKEVRDLIEDWTKMSNGLNQNFPTRDKFEKWFEQNKKK